MAQEAMFASRWQLDLCVRAIASLRLPARKQTRRYFNAVRFVRIGSDGVTGVCRARCGCPPLRSTRATADFDEWWVDVLTVVQWIDRPDWCGRWWRGHAECDDGMAHWLAADARVSYRCSDYSDAVRPVAKLRLASSCDCDRTFTRPENGRKTTKQILYVFYLLDWFTFGCFSVLYFVQ